MHYTILGDDLQTVEIRLDPREAVLAEAGAMVMMDGGIRMEAVFGDASQRSLIGKLFSAGKRLLVGESLFMTLFENRTDAPQSVYFGAPYPGKVVPVRLAEMGGALICQKDAFLCATPDTRINIVFRKRIRVGLFGGEGFILEKLEGNGLAFIHASGTIIERTLAAGEVVEVDTGCVVAFSPGVDYDVHFVRGIRNMLFGGEGIFLARLRGPGRIWVQSLPFSRLAGRIVRHSSGGKGEGSVLGRVWDVIGGDS